MLDQYRVLLTLLTTQALPALPKENKNIINNNNNIIIYLLSNSHILNAGTGPPPQLQAEFRKISLSERSSGI